MYHTFHRPVHYVAINARTIEIQNCACLLEAKISNAHFKLASPISECVKLYTHSCVQRITNFRMQFYSPHRPQIQLHSEALSLFLINFNVI